MSSDNTKELQIKITSEAQLQAADAAAAQVEKVAAAIDGQTKANQKAAAASKETAKATESSTDALTELGRRGNAARDVFEGLTAAGKSNEGMLFNLTKAYRGLTEAMRTNPFLAFVGVLAGAVGLFAQLVARMAEAGAQYVGIGKRSKELEKDLEQLKKTSEESTKAMVDQANQAANAWERLASAMDRAKQRADQMANAQQAAELADLDAQEATALARAPEGKRDTIKEGFERRRGATKARFEQARITGEATQAQVERGNAERAIAGASQRLYSVEVAANAAAKALATIEDVGRNAARSGASPARLAEISGEVMKARAASEAANKQLEEVRGKEQPLIDSASQRRSDAENRLELNAVERRTFAAQQRSRQLQEKAQNGSRQLKIRDLEEQARAAAGNGNFTEQDRLVSQARDLHGPTPEMAAAAAYASQTTQRAATVIVKSMQEQGDAMNGAALAAAAEAKNAKRRFDLTSKQIKNAR